MSTIPLILALFASAPADSWPAFRGTGDSLTTSNGLPLKWSEKANVRWRATLGGYGQSSPVAWKDGVYCTSAKGGEKETLLIARYDVDLGRLIWQKEFPATQTVKVSDYVSRSAPTPVVDGERVYAFFESGDVIAVQHNGQVAWKRSLTTEYGKFVGNHGVGSSPAITDKAVILLVETDGPAYLLAIDKATGKNLWKVDREPRVSWSSPIVASAENGERIFLSSNGVVECYSAADGKQIWSLDGVDGNTVASPTVTENLVLIGSSKSGSNLAVRRGGTGKLTADRIAWKANGVTSSFGSPLVHRGHAWYVNKAGAATCLDLATGKEQWTERLPAPCWCSPVGAGDRVYFFCRNGETVVMEAAGEARKLAENSIPTEDRVYGVAAVSGSFILRTGEELVCVGAAKKQAVSDIPAADDIRAQVAEIPADAETPVTGKQESKPMTYPELPEGITSFGAALAGHHLYIYGGHKGTAHRYSTADQTDAFLRLDLEDPERWEELPSGPKLQGLALVAHDGLLYRLGGFAARNAPEEDHDLWSVDEVARFDPAAGKWESLPPLPEPRSSHDAAVVGDSIYVVGGWAMQGEKATRWHQTAWKLDLTKKPLKWEPIARPPFERRALAVAAYRDRLYVIGGMQKEGGPTTAVSIYDPAADKWREGPALKGEPMEGFGNAAFSAGDSLFSSTYKGRLQSFHPKSEGWRPVRQLDHARFFHRMLPLGADSLLIVGGANMETGKVLDLESVPASGQSAARAE